MRFFQATMDSMTNQKFLVSCTLFFWFVVMVSFSLYVHIHLVSFTLEKISSKTPKKWKHLLYYKIINSVPARSGLRWSCRKILSRCSKSKFNEDAWKFESIYNVICRLYFIFIHVLSFLKEIRINVDFIFSMR